MNTIAKLIEHWESMRCPSHEGLYMARCTSCARAAVYQRCAYRARQAITVNPNTNINDIRQRIATLLTFRPSEFRRGVEAALRQFPEVTGRMHRYGSVNVGTHAQIAEPLGRMDCHYRPKFTMHINDIRKRIQQLHDNLVANKPENELEEECLHGLKKALEQFPDAKLAAVIDRLPEGWIYKKPNSMGDHVFHHGDHQFLCISPATLEKRDVAEIIRAMEVLS